MTTIYLKPFLSYSFYSHSFIFWQYILSHSVIFKLRFIDYRSKCLIAGLFSIIVDASDGDRMDSLGFEIELRSQRDWWIPKKFDSPCISLSRNNLSLILKFPSPPLMENCNCPCLPLSISTARGYGKSRTVPIGADSSITVVKTELFLKIGLNIDIFWKFHHFCVSYFRDLLVWSSQWPLFSFELLEFEKDLPFP